MELGHLLAVERAEVFYFPFFFSKALWFAFPLPFAGHRGGTGHVSTGASHPPHSVQRR